MPNARTETILERLEAVRARFESELSTIDESEAAAAIGPEGWPILHIVEHMGLAEKGMFSGLGNARPVEPNPNPEADAELVLKLRNREVRVDAAERSRPTGRFATLAEALTALSAARRSTIDYVASSDVDFDAVTANHPFFGVVSGHQLLIIMCGHIERHLDQIAEIRRSAPGTAILG
jgi:hypothetical protein